MNLAESFQAKSFLMWDGEPSRPPTHPTPHTDSKVHDLRQVSMKRLHFNFKQAFITFIRVWVCFSTNGMSSDKKEWATGRDTLS